MTNIVALSELPDELPVPDTRPPWKHHCSPRLDAVLDRLPVTNKTGTPTRIRRVLRNAGIVKLADLLCADERYLRRKGCGDVFMRDIAVALAAFDLAVPWGVETIVVRDGATAAEANVQRALKWIEARIAECVAEQERYGSAAASHQTVEQEVLTDVMLLLDGREPLNKRRWYGCREDIDCEREYGHEGPHRRTTEIDGVEETEVWP